MRTIHKSTLIFLCLVLMIQAQGFTKIYWVLVGLYWIDNLLGGLKDDKN